MADGEFVHIVDGTLVKCDNRSDLTKPEMNTAQTGSCLYTYFLTKQHVTVPVTDVMKLGLKTVGFWQ